MSSVSRFTGILVGSITSGSSSWHSWLFDRSQLVPWVSGPFMSFRDGELPRKCGVWGAVCGWVCCVDRMVFPTPVRVESEVLRNRRSFRWVGISNSSEGPRPLSEWIAPLVHCGGFSKSGASCCWSVHVLSSERFPESFIVVAFRSPVRVAVGLFTCCPLRGSLRVLLWWLFEVRCELLLVCSRVVL